MMQFIKTLLRLDIILGATAFLLPAIGSAQSSFLPQGSPAEHFLDRMQILQQTNPNLNFSSDRPISRKLAVRMAEMADSLSKAYPYDDFYHLSTVDRSNLHSLLMNNIEWVRGNTDSFASKHPVWNTFYTEKANFYEVTDKDFFLVVDPAIEETQSYETGNKERVFLNAKGLTLRGDDRRQAGLLRLSDGQSGKRTDLLPATGRSIQSRARRRLLPALQNGWLRLFR